MSDAILKFKSGNDIPVERATVTMSELKEICTGFYYYWHNEDGVNTQQGFDNWIDELMK